jgi:hypothetical protein
MQAAKNIFQAAFLGSKVEGQRATIQRFFFLVQTQRRKDAEISFLEFDRDLESKTTYERF